MEADVENNELELNSSLSLVLPSIAPTNPPFLRAQRGPLPPPSRSVSFNKVDLERKIGLTSSQPTSHRIHPYCSDLACHAQLSRERAPNLVERSLSERFSEILVRRRLLGSGFEHRGEGRKMVVAGPREGKEGRSSSNSDLAASLRFAQPGRSLAVRRLREGFQEVEI